jgi:AcrR family transcriptional regulator
MPDTHMPETRWVDSSAARRATKHSGHRAERRRAIIDAAAATIEELGEPLRTDSVAARAGVPRPHVYRHFDSKDELADEVARQASRSLSDRVRPTLSRSGTPPVIIGGVIAAAVAWADGNPNLYRFMAARQHAELGRDRDTLLGELAGALTAYLRIQTEATAPPGVLPGLVGMVDASIIWWLDHHDEDAAQVTARLARQVWLIMRDTAATLGIPITDDTWLALRDSGPGPGPGPGPGGGRH